MEGWKTYSLSGAIIIGTFVLVAMKILSPDSWWQGCTVAGGLWGVRTVAKKKYVDSKTPVEVKPENGGTQ